MIINSTLHEPTIYPANNWDEAVTMVRRQHFDIAFLDLFMPGGKSWDEELSTFRATAPDVPVCIVSSSNNQMHIKHAFKLGVKGYIRKTSGAPEVEIAISRLKNGGQYVPHPDLQSFPPASNNTDLQLTWRQKEILWLIAEGNSNKQIGSHLEITESTVKRHVYNLFKALRAKSRIDAIQIAKSQGFLMDQ